MVSSGELVANGCPSSFTSTSSTDGRSTPEADADDARAAKRPVTTHIHAMKLLFYHANGMGDVRIYTHQRCIARGGNLDVHGVTMRPGETLQRAANRCLESELEGHAVLTERVAIALEAYPGGTHSFEGEMILAAEPPPT